MTIEEMNEKITDLYRRYSRYSEYHCWKLGKKLHGSDMYKAEYVADELMINLWIDIIKFIHRGQELMNPSKYIKKALGNHYKNHLKSVRGRDMLVTDPIQDALNIILT